MQTYSAVDYSIEIGSVTESSLENLLLTNYAASKKVIMVDENTHDECLEYLLTSFDSLKDAEVMLLPAGEENKVLEVCFQVWQALSEYGIGRKDLILNLGGGVVTDMGGFIASVYKRGVDFIHIPTTLLGMVDASVGGKTGVDLGQFKNQLGVFKHPKKIYIDPAFLETLPEKELVNGYAEMLKHGVIHNVDLWDMIKHPESIDALKNLNWIDASVRVKFDVVERDPLEKNVRKILNFGHTVGHAIEGFFLEREPIGHGFAIAAGMIAEAYIALKRGMLKPEAYFEIELVILEYFPVYYFSESELVEIVQLAFNDKKNEAGKINCSLPDAIGSCQIDCFVEPDEVKDALRYMNGLGKTENGSLS